MLSNACLRGFALTPLSTKDNGRHCSCLWDVRDQVESRSEAVLGKIRKKQAGGLLLHEAKESGSLGEIAFTAPALTLPPNFYELQTHLYCQFHGIKVSFATPSLLRSS
jgi:hypothetical protein